MEALKLFDGELRLMELIWDRSPLPARQLALDAEAAIGWNKNTTYTVLKKLVEKQAVSRTEPGFLVAPLVTREQVRHAETDSLIRRLFQGSRKLFFSSFQDEALSEEEIEALRRLIRERDEARGNSGTNGE